MDGRESTAPEPRTEAPVGPVCDGWKRERIGERTWSTDLRPEGYLGCEILGS